MEESEIENIRKRPKQCYIESNQYSQLRPSHREKPCNNKDKTRIGNNAQDIIKIGNKMIGRFFVVGKIINVMHKKKVQSTHKENDTEWFKLHK